VLTCSAIGANIGGQTLSYSYSWVIDGASYSGAIQDLSAITVQPDTVVECTVMVSDTNGGTTQDSTTLTLDNRAPLVNSVSISPNTGVLSNTELTCLATVSDPDGESLSASYEWFRSGVPIGSNGVLQLSNTLVVPNDSVECVATVNDGFGGSNSDTSSVSVDNSAPSIDSSLLSLISPTRTDIITCSAAASDLDGGIPALLFVFTNQGTGVTYTATSSTADSATLDLSGTAIEYDEVVSCEITATDLDGGSVSATETATIINSVPVFAAEASISPNILVYTGTELTCSATATDADDGSLTLTYLWTNGSTQIGSGSSYTVLSDDTDVGDTINCTSTAIDANQFSITSQASVIVENTDPTVSNVQITGGLGAYYNNETVICSASTDDIDEIPTVSYVWSIAGVDLGYADSLDLGTTSLLPADSLTCTVSISDSNGGFASAFASISVGNREPSTPTVVISWTANGTNPIDTDELTCVGAGSTDLDGDSVSYTYSWTSDLGGSVSGNTVLSSVTSPSETWTCSVIASDGSLNSSTGVSSTTISCLMTDYETLNLGNGVDLEMESICSGTDPLGRYTLTNDFYLMTTEVTQRMFTELMNYNQSTNYGVGDNYPYYFVNWHMSADFANKVTQRHNTVNSTSLQECYTCLDSGTTSVTCSEAINPYQCTGYVLPTEGEWEYAARSGTLYDFWTPDGGGNYSSTSCGDGVSDTTVTIVDGFTNPPLSDYAWFCGNRHDSIFTNTAKPVGLKLPNEFGLYDMHGNVWEWTTDSYGCSFSGNDDPYCSLQVGSNHVSRGGAWSSDANAASASNSLDTSPSNTFFYIGFRLAFHP
jgi:formylglycine-generating enzyme required for sulfatase activity